MAGTLPSMAIVDPHWPRADLWLAAEHPDPVVAVVGVPSSAASLSPSHADRTPSELRRTLGRFSTYQGEWDVDVAEVSVVDRGDLPVHDLDMNAMPPAVTEMARSLPDVPLTLYVGGDNAITRPLVKATARDEIARIGVLTFDAHHDVRTLDLGPANGTPIRGLIEEDGLPGGNVVQIGIHSFANSLPYRRWCEAQGIGIYTIDVVEAWGIEDVVGTALDTLARTCDRIYVDVDVDVLDRAVAPGCPGSRPGGMRLRDLAKAVRMCGAHPAVTAMDFVEVDPTRDPEGLTLDALATVFLSAVAGYAARPSDRDG